MAANSSYQPLPPFRLQRWIAWVSIGEALGFAIPISVFAGLSIAGAPTAFIWIAVALAGAGEGAVLGYSQARAGGLPVRSWTSVTTLGAVVAWAIGMAPSSLYDFGVLDLESAPAVISVPAIVIAGTILLASIPTVQWILLRRLIPRAWPWIPLSMTAWLVALPWTFMVGLLFDERSGLGWVLMCFALAGVLMASTVALLTGLAMRHLRPRVA